MIPGDMDSRLIKKRMDEIMELFSTTFKVGNQEFSITASAGIAMYPWDDENSETLIKYANIAMQQAKHKGKNQYISFTNEMREEVETNLELAYDLQHALEREELVVYYQPQISLLTSEISGVEALVYWNHPTRGKINPGLFIPLAEQNGFINDIGEWVLETASCQNKHWQNLGLPIINVGVNVSPVQLISPNIVKNIEEVIRRTGLDAKYIELEITEGIAIEDTKQITTIMDGLKNIGVSIAIDDFGMKYSSLNRLRFLPIDRIKIDLHFIKHLNSNNTDRVITTGIIDLAKQLGLNVLAEGVETIWQLDFLKRKGCDNIQGFFYYKPMLPEEIEKILRTS